jgi:Protein of unknown function (DUF3987)
MDERWKAPSSHTWVDGQLVVDYPDGVVFRVSPLSRQAPGRLDAETLATVGESPIHHATLNWLDQRQRVDFHNIAAMWDGHVPWQALMVPIIPLLQAGPAAEAEVAPELRVPVEPFPVEVLPTPLARLVREAAEALPCAPDYVAVPMLGVLGAAIGTSRAVELKPRWHEGPRLNAAVIGYTGSKKSPALRVAMAPLFTRQHEAEAEYQQAKAAHQRHVREHEVELDRWRKAQRTGKTTTPPPVLDDAPTIARCWSSNVTVEALANTLKENPRRLLLYQDELTAWVHSMDQYKAGKGAVRQFWLSLWNGAPIAVDRVKSQKDPILLRDPFCNVIGMLPPGVLSELSDKQAREDGFRARILFAYPDDVVLTWRETSVSAEAEAGYQQVVDHLLALRGGDDDGPAARVPVAARAPGVCGVRGRALRGDRQPGVADRAARAMGEVGGHLRATGVDPASEPGGGRRDDRDHDRREKHARGGGTDEILPEPRGAGALQCGGVPPRSAGGAGRGVDQGAWRPGHRAGAHAQPGRGAQEEKRRGPPVRGDGRPRAGHGREPGAQAVGGHPVSAERGVGHLTCCFFPEIHPTHPTGGCNAWESGCEVSSTPFDSNPTGRRKAWESGHNLSGVRVWASSLVGLKP